MEYNNQLELYKALIPVFNVKKRLLLNDNYINITNEDIWKYLSITKWKYAYNLTISDMVNDIINIDALNIISFMRGGKK